MFKFKFKKPSVLGIAIAEPQPGNVMPKIILSLGSNIFLAGWFLLALLNPVSYVDFIVQTGIWLFLVEFLSIFVGGMGKVRFRFAEILSTAIGFVTVAIFAIVFGWLFLGSIYLPIIFLGSIIAKIFGWQAMSGQSYRDYSIPLILGSLLVVFFIFGPEFWVKLFPFPENLNQYMPEDWVARQESGEISGEFVDRPQTMLAWGVIYFSLAAVIELFLFRRRLKVAHEDRGPKVE